jgi:hypothetical protein
MDEPATVGLKSFFAGTIFLLRREDADGDDMEVEPSKSGSTTRQIRERA